jgi:hypothetical protein
VVRGGKTLGRMLACIGINYYPKEGVLVGGRFPRVADQASLSSRIPLLYSLARNGKNVTSLLNSPSLLYGKWKDIENLSKCYMFSRAVDEIQTRHVFLQRFVSWFYHFKTERSTFYV